MRIGFIGLGIMGEAMCYNIIRKHDGDVYIYDVKTEPVQRLAQKGGIACDSAVDAAKTFGCDHYDAAEIRRFPVSI